MHTTNYFNTFIEIAEDCKVEYGVQPPIEGDKKSIANHQFDWLYEHPYKYTSDEVLFGVFAARKEFEKSEISEQQEYWFSKGQPCFRASPLTKSYGWGIHSNEEGKIAIYSAHSAEYHSFLANANIKKIKALRSKKAVKK